MGYAVPQATHTLEEEMDVLRKRWTRDECRQLMEMGILEEARFELVRGEIILKMTQHERHVFTCKQVQLALEAIFGEAYVRMAAPIAIEEHEEPEPDAAVMTRPRREYLSLGTPLPSDVRLAVEVSDSTLRFDLRAKTGQYADAGIPEYWVVDIPNGLLHVFREPAEGGYASAIVLAPEDEIRPLAAPDKAVRVGDLLP